MIESQPPERGDLAASDSKELAPFSLEYLPWEPRRAPARAVAKAIGAVFVGVGLASAGAFMILDRVGLPSPDGVPQLEPRMAQLAEASVDRAAVTAAASVAADTPAEAVAPVPAPPAPPVILATAVPRADASTVRPAPKKRAARPARAVAIPTPRSAFVDEVAPSEVAPTDEVAPSEVEGAMPYEPAPEVPSLDWIPADVEPGEPERFAPSEP